MKMGFPILQVLIFLMLFLKTCSSNNPSLQLSDDVLGLIVFKSDLHDPFSNLVSWNEDDESPCSWKYIKCNPRTNKVSEISLQGLGLSGKMNRGLEKLQNLQVLSLAHNNFSGNIIPQFFLNKNLKNLNLSHNHLSGFIPIDFNLSSIKVLDFSNNLISGPIPDSLFQNCLSLNYISLANNVLEGLIPSSLQKCTSLGFLNLSNNHLSGYPDFVNGFYTLKGLRIIDLSNNEFSGPISKGLSSLHYLKELHLQGNQFSGSLPDDLGLCPHLTHLDLSTNLLTGNLPYSIQKLNSLIFFSLSKNKITCDFPKWIGKMGSLEYLDFSSNVFIGNLPESLGDLKSLNFLSLSDNQMSGTLPMSLVYCSKLFFIQLKGNNFNGSIPKSLFDMGLEVLDLSLNRFTGSIPPGSSRIFESIRELDLSENKLTGIIPAKMGLSSHLQYLNLSWNNLRSELPMELGYFQDLSILDLRYNELYGSIPEDLCESKNLAILQLDGNSMSGLIPEEMGNCSSLYLLSLSHNKFIGSIPKALSRLKKLRILNLEFNELTGEIPQELGSLNNLLAVNISYNRLTGRLPMEGIFKNLGRSSLEGNLGICSPLLKGPCKMNVSKPLVLDPFSYGNQMGGTHGSSNQVPSSSSDSVESEHRRFFSISAIISISAAFLVVFGVIVVSLLNISTRRRITFRDNGLESICSSSQAGSGISTVTGKLVLFDTKSSEDWIHNPETLLNKACEIGRGVFGTVYKVSLGREGRSNVAIKKLVTSNILQNPEDFDREVRILGKVKHPNIMIVKGYYWTPNLQLLISDYAPNGSLYSLLHERPLSVCLSWAIRFKIALGTAKGLAHLHQSFHQPIIHYNVKPSNILLDENYNPKISDFGLARLLTKLDKHVISSRFQSALGYMAPELACQSIRINEKCDVYGFGVMVLELVTGRRPVEYGEDDVLILSDYVRVLLEEGNVLDCVDPNMNNEYPEDEVLPVLKLGLVCTSQIPSSRPSMAEVVQILQVIKTPIPLKMEVF